MTIAALILAAGQSSRMRRACARGTHDHDKVENKLLADVGGMPMVARVADAALASRARPVLAVTGHQAEKVRAALANRAVEVVHNPDYVQGMSTSLRVGIAALGKTGVTGALVLLGDMPKVTAATIDKLIAAFAAGDGRAICVPEADGRRGNPVLWPRNLFREMSTVSGDQGARDLLVRHAARVTRVAAPPAEIFADVDKPEDLAQLRKNT